MILAREAIELLGQMARILWFEGTKHGLRDREWMALRFLSRANRFSRTPSALASSPMMKEAVPRVVPT